MDEVVKKLKMCLAEAGYPDAMVMTCKELGHVTYAIWSLDDNDVPDGINPPSDVADRAFDLCGVTLGDPPS